jgi:hypothetical protein
MLKSIQTISIVLFVRTLLLKEEMPHQSLAVVAMEINITPLLELSHHPLEKLEEAQKKMIASLGNRMPRRPKALKGVRRPRQRPFWSIAIQMESGLILN